MIKSETKEIIKTFTEVVPTEGYCDVCNKKLEKNFPFGFDEFGKQRFYYNYFLVTTHHYDWGNDSCESYNYYDICSSECLQKFISVFWKDHFKVNNTHEMEIETVNKLRKD